MAICDQDRQLSLPDANMVREIRFDAPGCAWYSCCARGDVEEVVAFFEKHRSGWKEDRVGSHAEFLVSLDVGKAKPLEVRAGRSRETAFLQTTTAGREVLIHEISVTELSRLLDLCQCDLSVAYLQRDKGYYKTLVDKVLAHNTQVAAKDVDASRVAAILDGVLGYSRATPGDTAASTVLRQLDSLEVSDFAPGWYVVCLSGCGFHCFARMIVSTSGEAMPATPQTCLSALQAVFGDVSSKDNARKLCAKVLEGSGLGTMITDVKEIPGYERKPIAPDKGREIRPMYEYRVGNHLSFVFFAYERLGGRVWRCELSVEGSTVTWKNQELAEDIGDAAYIK